MTTSAARVPGCRPALRVPLVALVVAALALGAAGCSASREDRLAAVRARLEANQLSPADIEDLRRLLADDPDDAEASFLLGSSLIATRQWSRAIISLERSLASEAFRRDAAVLLTTAYLNTNNTEGALSVADRLIELEPDGPTGWHLRARARIGLNRFEEGLADTDRLLALEPDDPRALELRARALIGLGRMQDAEQVLARQESLAEARGDLAAAGKACTIAAFGLVPRGSNRAEAVDRVELDRCVQTYPTDPAVLDEAAEFYREVGEGEKARAVFEEAVDLAPEVTRFRIALANQYWMEGKRDEAIATMRQAAEDFATPSAYLGLAEFQRLADDIDGALESAELAAELAPDAPAVAYRRAELMVAAGRLEEAHDLAESLPEGPQRTILLGQIAVERGDPAAGLALLEQGLAGWPDNARARALAGRAAQELLDVDRALDHYRESVRADARATNAGLIAARILHARGRHDEAFMMLVEYANSHPGDVAAFRLAVQAADASGGEERLDAVLELMDQGTPEGRAAGLAERVKLVRREEGSAAAAAFAAGQGCDLDSEVCEPVLAELADAWLGAGEPDKGLVLIDSAIAARPEATSLHNLRGRLLVAAGRPGAARASFERALELEPGNAQALSGLGSVAIREGDLPAAVAFLDRSAAADAANGEAMLRAAQVLFAMGERKEAERRFRAVLGLNPASAGAANDLAWLLAEDRRELDLAARLARQAVASDPSPNHLDTLAWVQIQRGTPERAVETLERALEVAPADPRIRYRLALAQIAMQDEAAARSSLEQALATGPFPEADEARATLARLGAGGSE